MLPSHFEIRPQQHLTNLKQSRDLNILQLSIKVRVSDASLALWILAKVTTLIMESLHFLKIIGKGNDLSKYLNIFT